MLFSAGARLTAGTCVELVVGPPGPLLAVNRGATYKEGVGVERQTAADLESHTGGQVVLPSSSTYQSGSCPSMSSDDMCMRATLEVPASL